jgi:hypothetical protein
MPEPHAHTAGDTERSVPLRLSPLQTQPVLVLSMWAIVMQAAAALVLFARRQFVAGTLVGVSALVTGVGGALARSRVTPMAQPRDNDGDPLTPLADSEYEVGETG